MPCMKTLDWHFIFLYQIWRAVEAALGHAITHMYITFQQIIFQIADYRLFFKETIIECKLRERSRYGSVFYILNGFYILKS